MYRVYYYDAPPYTKAKNKPLSGGKHNFAKDDLTIHNIKLLNDLAKEDHFALRMGEVRFRGWELNKDSLPKEVTSCEITTENLRPSLQQKGVANQLSEEAVRPSLSSNTSKGRP